MAYTLQVGSMTFTKPNDTTLVADRTLDAVRELVWAAHTECRRIKQWLLGPEGWSMPTCEIDLRPGGAWRYVYQGPDGAIFSMSGEYRLVQSPERAINTETMDDAPIETLNTLTLTEENGRTLVHTVVEHPPRRSAKRSSPPG